MPNSLKLSRLFVGLSSAKITPFLRKCKHRIKKERKSLGFSLFLTYYSLIVS